MRVRRYAYTRLGLLTALMIAIPAAPVIAADAAKASSGPIIVANAEEHHPDAWITTKVKSKLLAEHFLTGLEIKVSTHDGVVQLSGYVKTAEQVSMAEKLAAGTDGVKRVQNDLIIK
ncbi:MAG TPA: BON domain-containing protein [Thiobacillaceae bacterium]|nr:BON domain-containing protein [Thiobacillaceae bacterium]